MTPDELSKIEDLAVKLGLKIRRKKRLRSLGRWSILDPKTVWIQSNDVVPRVLLHEIGHALVGGICCLEHAEALAHGAAIGLAASLGIELAPIETPCSQALLRKRYEEEEEARLMNSEGPITYIEF